MCILHLEIGSLYMFDGSNEPFPQWGYELVFQFAPDLINQRIASHHLSFFGGSWHDLTSLLKSNVNKVANFLIEI